MIDCTIALTTNIDELIPYVPIYFECIYIDHRDVALDVNNLPSIDVLCIVILHT